MPERNEDMSSYKEGQVHQLVNALEKAKWSEDDLTKLGQYQDKGSILAVLHGRAEIVTKPILDLVTTTTLPAHDRFVVRDHFKVDTSDTAPVKIGYLGENFKKHFLDKIEEAGTECKLRIDKLLEDSLDKPILSDLSDRAETTMARVWQLLLLQPKGEEGKLLTNGFANIFYVRDDKGVLWAVYVRWYSGCGDWDVEACSAEFPGRWDAGYQVISRDS